MIENNHIEEKKSEYNYPKKKEQKQSEKFSGLFSEKHLLKRYGRIPIYKPILDVVENSFEDQIHTSKVAEIIDNFFRVNLDRKLTKNSLASYASSYGRYLEEEGVISRIKTKGVWKKVNSTKSKNENKKENNEDLKEIEKKIIKLAKKNMWYRSKKEVSVSMISQMLNEKKQKIIKAIINLINENRVSQRPKEKIIFVR